MCEKLVDSSVWLAKFTGHIQANLFLSFLIGPDKCSAYILLVAIPLLPIAAIVGIQQGMVVGGLIV